MRSGGAQRGTWREQVRKRVAAVAGQGLHRHNCLTYEYALRDEWVFVDAAGGERKVRVSGSLRRSPPS
jgi:hypothetical protein